MTYISYNKNQRNMYNKWIDFVKYAQSFGIEAEAVATQEEFAEALSRALADTENPRVIVLNVWRSFVEPMIKGGARIDEFVEFK